MPDIPKFGNLPDFPIASVIEAASRNAKLQEEARQAGNQSLIAGLQSIGQIGQSLYDTKKRMAESLALKSVIFPELPDEVAKNMEPDQMLKAKEAVRQIILAYPDSNGNLQQITAPKGSKVAGVGAGATPSIAPGVVDESTGLPLLVNRRTGKVSKTTADPGITPVPLKGSEEAINNSTLLANQIPNIKTMFDAYRNSKSPRLQSTPAGRLMNPSGKQAEDSLKLAAFTFGGKNLTGQEKEVVFGALFPSWTDDEQSRQAKEQLLTNYMTGKIDLMQAANLLGPAGSKMRETLAKYQSQGAQKQTSSVPVASTPVPTPNSDLAHLSTKELMDLRAKMTAHKEEKK